MGTEVIGKYFALSINSSLALQAQGGVLIKKTPTFSFANQRVHSHTFIILNFSNFKTTENCKILIYQLL